MFCWTVLLIRTLLNVVVSAEGDVPDSEVVCVFMDSCVLPCSFQSSRDDDVIHWFQGTGGQIHVHSFYNNQDQLGLQDQNFRNRTSLFQDQISRGNASLLLRGVKVQDQVTYQCFTRTVHGTRNSFVLLRVDAPVSTVGISQEGNWITCSSEGIYPEPGLTWSTIPPSNLSLQNRTRVHQTEDQLYSISSSLKVPDGGSDLTYSCTVRTQRSNMTVTFRRPVSGHVEVAGIVSGVVVPLLVVLVLAAGLFWFYRRRPEEQLSIDIPLSAPAAGTSTQ